VSKDYWYGNYSSITENIGKPNYDERGVHSCCTEFGTGANRHAPIASLDLGEPTKAILKCIDGSDVSEHHAGFVQVSKTQVKAILQDPEQHFFKLVA